ncbi:hypothetical protein OGAPHI_004052 [Ogataea philodendri]|uniref:Origin recognition complex subunit 3 n=1 Tax=Ogataea philodendri TaxID=1378263 RepID=A0A9P8P734_9ASCO|nr:uncharacterized protein OGAPHI_004052 [Ogataea philodendri]KAH3665864.1 hypothetical protein OGAPHI_004052 [Ogataea philodendri]
MSFDDFMDSQKVVYELAGDALQTDEPSVPVFYTEGVPTNAEIPFVRLLNGNEPEENQHRRYELFCANWSKQHASISRILAAADEHMFVELDQFFRVQDTPTVFLGQPRNVSTALLNLGPNISNHSLLLDKVWTHLDREIANAIVVRLSSKVCSTVSFTMKILATQITRGLKTELDQAADEAEAESDADDAMSDADEDETQSRVFDMDSLMEKVYAKEKILIVMVEDADSFPTAILTPLVKLMWDYNNAYDWAIKLVIGMSTPFEIFQEKLPKLTVRYLQPKYFEIDNSDTAVTHIMEELLFNIHDPYNSLIFDPKLVLEFLKLKSRVSTAQFINSIKIIYMGHYFSQPLSVMWTNDFTKTKLNSYVFDVFKRLPSVRSYSQYLDKESAQHFHKLLLTDNDEDLGKLLRTSINKLILWRYEMKTFFDLLNFMQEYFLESSVWTQNLDLFRLTFQNVHLDDPDKNLDNFEFLQPLWQGISKASLHDINSFVKTVMEDEDFGPIFQESQLWKLSSKTEVSKLVSTLNNAFLQHLEDLDLNKIPFREICCVDLSAMDLLSNSFNPKIRETCIDSLLNSQNYLFNTMHSDLKQLHPEHPDIKLYKLLEPSVIELFKLSREAGVVSNVYDFYQVFKSSLPREQLEPVLQERTRQTGIQIEWTDLNWDKMTLSWFLKSLAELQTLGFVREVKNKSDTLEKLIWKDL